MLINFHADRGEYWPAFRVELRPGVQEIPDDVAERLLAIDKRVSRREAGLTGPEVAAITATETEQPPVDDVPWDTPETATDDEPEPASPARRSRRRRADHDEEKE